MAHARLKKELLEIAVPIPSESEDIVGAALERAFGVPASFYTNEETRQTVATVYLAGAKAGAAAEARRKAQSAITKLADEGLLAPAGPARVRRLKPENWAHSWKKHFHPIEIGKSLLIKPSWSRRKTKPGQALMILDPGLSFGTGQHATTRFCLEQLVRFRDPARTQSFLDIGTGSGILLIAAAKLGYRPARGFDFDPESVRVARANAAANGVSGLARPTRLDVKKLPLRGGRAYGMVCANLIYDLLLSEARRIGARVAASGWLVLSGILVSQFSAVETFYRGLGFHLSHTAIDGEWQSGLFQRRRS